MSVIVRICPWGDLSKAGYKLRGMRREQGHDQGNSTRDLSVMVYSDLHSHNRSKAFLDSVVPFDRCPKTELLLTEAAITSSPYPPLLLTLILTQHAVTTQTHLCLFAINTNTHLKPCAPSSILSCMATFHTNCLLTIMPLERECATPYRQSKATLTRPRPGSLPTISTPTSTGIQTLSQRWADAQLGHIIRSCIG